MDSSDKLTSIPSVECDSFRCPNMRTELIQNDVRHERGNMPLVLMQSMKTAVILRIAYG